VAIKSLQSFASILIALVSLSVMPFGQARAADCCPPKGSGQRSQAEPKPNTVLNPAKFFGRAALGYSAAKLAPDLCQKLFCYCGCDMTDSHANLLDCFTCDHGADCQICQDEAIIGLHMKQEGKSLFKIQKSIDEAFSQQYPWDKPSSQLTKYRESIKPEADQSKDADRAAATPVENIAPAKTSKEQ
jgi:hypothetical protein